MLIGLNHYWDIIQPDFIRLSCGFVAQNSKIGYIITVACFNNYSTSFSPPTARNGGSCRDVADFWSLESIGVIAPVSTMTDSGTCSKKQNDSNMSIVTPSVFSMTESGTCSNNQNDLCCISSSPLTAGNGVRLYSDLHNFWSLGSRGIDSPVSSVTDSVESVKADENKRYSGALPGKDKEAKMTDSGTCSDNQIDLCCIPSSPPMAGNGVRPHSDLHDFLSWGSIGINATVSSMLDSVLIRINRMIQIC